MKSEPNCRSSEYRVCDVTRQKWTVEIDFASWQEAETFVRRCQNEGLLPPFRHGPRLGKGESKRVKKRRA